MKMIAIYHRHKLLVDKQSSICIDLLVLQNANGNIRRYDNSR